MLANYIILSSLKSPLEWDISIYVLLATIFYGHNNKTEQIVWT